MRTRQLFLLWLLAVPAVVLAWSAPRDVRIPPLERRATPAAALFSHGTHQSQQCFACHPTIFEQAAKGFTHEQMRAGRFCGACHDGRITTAINSIGCPECHVAR